MSCDPHTFTSSKYSSGGERDTRWLNSITAFTTFVTLPSTSSSPTASPTSPFSSISPLTPTSPSRLDSDPVIEPCPLPLELTNCPSSRRLRTPSSGME